ncbi:von Willebrand factor A domain-containing protein 3B-like isoform X1 [Denticeps clupeoides]|uniref:von Willebrand factor A domain-containing protein 3B-like isoform X1 n=2 Tax=Denticeps clupeoides TaxID=299321 RepID=UPI0010A3BC53|nr:von Willebrand factor A domain-containing protein 3B-like isoform X1 [Denticeps clupeoides]
MSRPPGGNGAGRDDVVNALVSPHGWLRDNGLQRSKLSLPQILTHIGFRQRGDYVHHLRKSISSKYADGMFPQITVDGTVHNITATREELESLCEKLEAKAKLCSRRLDWLTTGSRKLFGVIQEKSVTLVLDVGCSATRAQQKLGKQALCKVICEQVSQMDCFNIMSSGIQGVSRWQEKAVKSTEANLSSAMDWLLAHECEPSTGRSTAEVLLNAMGDVMIEAVYLFVVGDLVDDVAGVLRGRLKRNVCPVHTVSFNGKTGKGIQALRDLSNLTAGRIHEFAQMEYLEHVACDSPDRSNGHLDLSKFEPIGGMSQGSKVREDVYQVWREMREALKTRNQIKRILVELLPQRLELAESESQRALPEDCLSSKEWLNRFGLKAQKLRVHEALADCAFPHSDGVVGVKCRPLDETIQTDAETCKKLINAKYCTSFVHMRWKDGSVVHVYVTDGKCRKYEEQMNRALINMNKRLEWLKSGSRELFGTIVEDQVYLLIDTSEAMRDFLDVVKEKVFQLMQDQLSKKQKVNVVAFGTRVTLWKNRLVEVSSETLASACRWVNELQAGGTKNTLGALGQALADEGTQAVYLLTDGQPDQPPGVILEQVRGWSPVPVHTISFNCDDHEANSFLYELSQWTGGRFHSYYANVKDFSDLFGICKDRESDDLQLLMAEIDQGRADLETVRRLRAECIILDTFHQKTNTTQRTGSTQQLHSTQGVTGIQLKSARHAAQTTSSMLRLLSSSEQIHSKAPLRCPEGPGQEWLLPESLALFQTNADRQMQVLQSFGLVSSDTEQKKERKKQEDPLDIPTAQWLKTNSLVARRLTLLDALSPTAIVHHAKYVPMLDKHVHSKVFNEIMPLAHIGGKGLTLINPLAVDLEKYKCNVQDVLKTYERRLDLIVWRGLTQEEREKFGNEAVAFSNHREAMLEALEGLKWPVAREDLDLLEKEIHKGQSFLQQASDLQLAARQMSRAAQDVNNSRVERGLSKNQSEAPKMPLDCLRGQRVVARSDADGFYYPGTVRKRLPGKRVKIDFTSGESEVISLACLLTVGGSGPCPPLVEGDFVLVATRREVAGDRFVPGIILVTPCHHEALDKLFTILKYNNKKIHRLRSKIIKISQTRYWVTCKNLQQIQQSRNIKTTEALINQSVPENPPSEMKQ